MFARVHGRVYVFICGWIFASVWLECGVHLCVGASFGVSMYKSLVRACVRECLGVYARACEPHR